jgi:phage-related tail fiber protein
MIDQTSQFFAILTNVGAAKQANADALGVAWTISKMGVGDAKGSDPVPDPAQTQLINEQRRAPLNQLRVDDSNSAIIIAEQVIPAEVGGWWIREIGLYDADDDLVAIANCAPSFKPLLAQGSGRTQIVRINLLVSNASNIELKIDPSVVLASRDYVDRMRLGILGELATRIINVNTSKTLTTKDMGLVLIDASAADLVVQLPPANSKLGTRDVIVRRTDNQGTRLVIKAAGTDRLKFHTHLNPYGYPLLVLMGAGDWWHLRSDAKGSWWPIGRHDSTPLGRPVFETTTVFNPGGYGALNGPTLLRAEWPWLWDHAQNSGMTVLEAQRLGNEGGWTEGDGNLTFRGPEGRGEFLRVMDEGRGVDVNRTAGSYQAPEIQSHVHTMILPRDWGGSVAGNAVLGDQNNYGFQDVTTTSTGGDETRPRNIAYPGRIKLI